MMRVALLLAFALLSAPAAAQTPAGSDDPDTLERASDAAEQRGADYAARAQLVASEVAELQRRLITAGRAQREREEEALAVEARVSEFDARATRLAARIAEDREGLGETLAALQRVSRARPPAIAGAKSALEAARAAALLAEIAPALNARAKVAAADLAALRRARQQVVSETRVLDQAYVVLDEKREEILALITEKQLLASSLRADAARANDEARALAARAQNMRDLIARLRRPGAAGEGGLSAKFAEARGALALPAAGQIVRRFGDSEGVTIHTARGAQVTSPFDARVKYSGSFRGYGQLVLLDVGGGYHMVMSGLSSLYAVAGQSVLAGEPLGTMPQEARPRPELYWEIRENGQTIDPEPWLRG